MPSVPMLMPSATVIVPKMIDFPPAAAAPAPASRASASICMLQGVSMLQVEAMPTTVFLKSLSLKPTARNMERLGARSDPSCTLEEYFRRRLGVDMVGGGGQRTETGGKVRTERHVKPEGAAGQELDAQGAQRRTAARTQRRPGNRKNDRNGADSAAPASGTEILEGLASSAPRLSPFQAEHGNAHDRLTEPIRRRLGSAEDGEPQGARQIHPPQAVASRRRLRQQFLQIAAGLSAQPRMRNSGGKGGIRRRVSHQRRQRVPGSGRPLGWRGSGCARRCASHQSDEPAQDGSRAGGY